VRGFARVRRHAVSLLSAAAALSTTLGLGLVQAPQAHADTWGCAGLIHNDFAYCINSESEYDQPIGNPWRPTDPAEKYMDQVMILRRCLTSADGKCTSDYGPDGQIMKWEIDKITWVNPRHSDYFDQKEVSTSAPSFGCTSGSHSINTTFTPGHGSEFESFGFLPDVGTEREHHPNFLSKAFGTSVGLLGDITFGASTPSTWQLGETHTVNVDRGDKAWLNLTPGFVKLQGEAILHMQYRWNGGVRPWHHLDLRVRDADFVVPHTVYYNGAKIQSAASAFRSKMMDRREWATWCRQQSPNPWHNLKIRTYPNTNGIRVTDKATGYAHCFGIDRRNRTPWLDTKFWAFQGDDVQVDWYNTALCSYGGTQPNRPTFRHMAPRIDGLTNWWIS
jgi:hypothetical protein